MSLSLLQMRLKKNEEDFARLNSISFDDEVKDVKKKMPGENNPWSGELKARRKESRTAEAEGTKNTKKTKSPVELKSESKDKVKLLNTSKLSSDSLHTPSKLLDTNQTDTNHNDTATKDSIEDTVADTNTLTNTNLDKTEIHRDVLTNTNIKPRKYENKNLLDKKLKPSQEEQEEESNANKFEVYSPEETNSNETVNNSVAVNDHKQGTGDEDSEILKITRRNLKPVLQPFKRSESITDDVQTETPVERLIRQGSLEATSEQPKARPSTNNQTRTMQDLSEKIDEQQVREEEKLKKKSEEYLMVNFPAGVRKNLKGIILPEKDEELGERVTNTDSEDEDEGEWDENEDWEWEEEEEEEAPAKCNGVKNDDKPVDAEGKANITITENLVTIDRSKVDWSDDEFDEEDDEPETNAPPPPPPPPGPPAPPPPPPAPPGVDKKPSFKSERVEQLKKRPTKRPDWNDLMQEIAKYRCPGGLLKKTVCNDRSKPILSKSKVKGVFVYESEKHSKEADILKEISTGARLKHVRTNDRSKPNLKGIKSFKRQLTKEEKLDKGFSFGDDTFEEVGELEDLEKLKDDLESTKQLLELEVRSKNLLEKDNKKLQAEIERLKSEFSNHKEAGDQTPDILNNILTRERRESISKERRESIKEKKKSIIDNINNEVIENTTSESEVQKVPAEQVPEEVFEEIDELKEEAEEARKLAEEWEAKYKEMQRQMEMLDGPGGMYGKKNSTAGMERPSFQRMLSTASSDGVEDANNRASAAFGEPEEDDWMQKREVTQLQTKLRNTKDKKEIIVRERNLLSERIDNLKESIAKEFEARKNLKKDVKDMNAAFKEEMADMEADMETQKNLEDCYWSDEEDLVKNPYAKAEKENSADDDSAEMVDFMEEDDLEESVEEILKSAEECEEVETDPGADLFNANFNEDSDTEGEPDANDHVQMSEHLNKRIERESEKVTLMRKSNFALKSKIDILYDILQTQKEKHFDLKQELNRMLSDIQ